MFWSLKFLLTEGSLIGSFVVVPVAIVLRNSTISETESKIKKFENCKEVLRKNGKGSLWACLKNEKPNSHKTLEIFKWFNDDSDEKALIVENITFWSYSLLKVLLSKDNKEAWLEPDFKYLHGELSKTYVASDCKIT